MLRLRSASAPLGSAFFLQALQEAEEPVLQELHQMLEGKRLVVSSTALQTYHRLVRQMGGEEDPEPQSN